MSVFSFRTLSFRRFLPVLFVMLMGVLGLTPSPVAAHNSLIESDPKEGAVLVSAPPIWTLTFKNDVPLSSASGEIIDSAGIRIELPAPRFGANQKQIVFSLPTELTGNVTARWRLVNTDGHVVSARVKFTIGTPTKPTTGADVSNSMYSCCLRRARTRNQLSRVPKALAPVPPAAAAAVWCMSPT